MKRLLAVFVIALSVSGCNLAAMISNTQDVAQEAREILGQIRAGYKISASILDAKIVALCSRLPEIDSGAMEVRRIFVNPSPTTKRLLDDADDALDRTAVACASYKGNGSSSTFVKLATAFEAGRHAVINAHAAGGS